MSSEDLGTVVFDQQVYDLDVIKKAAYKFSDVVSFDFALKDGSIVCKLSPVKESENLNAVIHNFQNEVLDQDLRKKISLETKDIRNVILAHVFSNTGLQDG